MDLEFEKRVELPSIHEVFYAKPEPTYILNTVEPYAGYQRLRQEPHGDRSPTSRYRTQAQVAPQAHVVSSSVHPQGLVLSVPLCCEKCVIKVRIALQDTDGVRGVLCDQYAQRVVGSGTVDPETVLRRVRRVKEKSSFWSLATQPIQYSSSSGSVNASRAPAGFHISAYQAPLARPYNIDSAYRSGYVESTNRFLHDEIALRFDRGSPYVEMDDAGY